MADQKDKSLKKVSGGTIIDYVAWRGDLTFEHSPWGEIDAVIAAMVAYANLGENELVFGSGRTLKLADLAGSDVLERYPQEGIGDSVKIRDRFLTDLACSRRFQDITVLDQVNDVDASRDIQFSAMTLDVPGVGIVIAFRGTDPSLVGWKEDFMMSYESPVPAQAAAVAYLERAAAQRPGDLYVTGHSKGGNLAVYAASHVSVEIQARLKTICSFDGPGLDDETMASQGYLNIRDRIHSVIPDESVVGLLMHYHPDYRVVESTATSLFQHEPFTWKLLGKEFVERAQVSLQSRVLDQTMHEWLSTCSKQERKIFVQAVFSLFEKKQNRGALPEMDAGSRRMIGEMLRRLIATQAGNTYAMHIRQPLAQAAEELRNRLWGEEEPSFKSDLIPINNQGVGFDAAVEETRRAAEYCGLDAQNALRLQLFTEEMLSMVRTITGEMDGSFWIERSEQQYQLHLTTRAQMDRKQREALIHASSERINDASRGFLGRLREAFEQAMTSDRESVIYDLAEDRPEGMLPEWDRYEQSVLLKLADDVRIAIRGSQVSLTVTKAFSG